MWRSLCDAVLMILACKDSEAWFSLQAAVPEFTVKLRSGEKEIDEKITVNTEEETETVHITNDRDLGDVDTIYDFKRVGTSD